MVDREALEQIFLRVLWISIAVDCLTTVLFSRLLSGVVRQAHSCSLYQRGLFPTHPKYMKVDTLLVSYAICLLKELYGISVKKLIVCVYTDIRVGN